MAEVEPQGPDALELPPAPVEGLVLVFQRMRSKQGEHERVVDVSKERTQGITTGLELAAFFLAIQGQPCTPDHRLELAMPEAERGPGCGVLVAWHDPRTNEREVRGSTAMFSRPLIAQAALQAWYEDTRLEASLRRLLPEQLTRALKGLATLGKKPSEGVVAAAPGAVRSILGDGRGPRRRR